MQFLATLLNTESFPGGPHGKTRSHPTLGGAVLQRCGDCIVLGAALAAEATRFCAGTRIIELLSRFFQSELPHGSMVRSLRSHPERPVERSVLNRLGNVFGLKLRNTVEIGNRARNFQDAVMSAGA